MAIYRSLVDDQIAKTPVAIHLWWHRGFFNCKKQIHGSVIDVLCVSNWYRSLHRPLDQKLSISNVFLSVLPTDLSLRTTSLFVKRDKRLNVCFKRWLCFKRLKHTWNIWTFVSKSWNKLETKFKCFKMLKQSETNFVSKRFKKRILFFLC